MVVLNDLHFRLLESFLDRVESSGGETESGVLTMDGEFISSLLHGIQGPVASAIKILRTLKDLDMILHALWEAVENGLSIARKKLLPVTRHHGILSLPLEIVTQIFRQVYDDDADCATQSIPLVNHYFRDIAIGTPELWTRLSPGRNPTLFIERSKPLGLDVDLAKDMPETDYLLAMLALEHDAERTGRAHYRSFVEMVLPEAERWTSLMILTKHDITKEDFEWTRDVLAGKTFAALRELRMEADNRYWGSLRDFDPLYSDWRLPSLRLVKSKNVLPSIHPASLTCLHLHVGNSCYFRDTSIDLKGVMAFLQTVPLLTELSLDIGWFRTVTFRVGTDVTLPNVKTLRLSVKTGGGTGSPLRDFLASIRTPNVSDLSVDVTTKFASKLIPWIDEIFSKGNSLWPSLDSLDLSMSYESRGTDVDDNHNRLGTSAPYDLFERIPSVRHLSIRAVNIDPPNPTNWNVQFPHLRTLSFRDCNEFDIDFILDICEIFEAPEFETLGIHNCEKIDPGLVRGMMPEGKAFVSTVDWNISVL